MMSLAKRAQMWTADQLGRLLSVLHYQFFFESPGPWSSALAAHVQTWEQRRKKGDAPIPKTQWEQQYQTGHWNFLRRIDELGRFSLIVGYIRELKPDACVLDVGCGEGLLFQRLQPIGCKRYLGLDISETAVAKAREMSDGHFICADAERYAPEDTYDVIVFNECLYYFHKPLEAVDRYVTRLAPQGIVIVSTFPASRRGRSILRALKRKHAVLDETHLSHASLSWTCSVLGPSLEKAD